MQLRPLSGLRPLAAANRSRLRCEPRPPQGPPIPWPKNPEYFPQSHLASRRSVEYPPRRWSASCSTPSPTGVNHGHAAESPKRHRGVLSRRVRRVRRVTWAILLLASCARHERDAGPFEVPADHSCEPAVLISVSAAWEAEAKSKELSQPVFSDLVHALSAELLAIAAAGGGASQRLELAARQIDVYCMQSQLDWLLAGKPGTKRSGPPPVLPQLSSVCGWKDAESYHCVVDDPVWQGLY